MRWTVLKEAGKKFIINVADLFKVKAIISVLVITTTCVLTCKGMISTEAFMAVTGSVITYYFTKNKEEANL